MYLYTLNCLSVYQLLQSTADQFPVHSLLQYSEGTGSVPAAIAAAAAAVAAAIAAVSAVAV